MDDLKTHATNTWCPGCGDFGILNAFKRTVRNLEEKGFKRENLVIGAGIGCAAKIFDYLNLSGFYSLHGRSMATVQGIKLANPSLKVVTFAGDGDSYGEGLAHMVFAAKRNADIAVIVHDNGVYGLTTGQFTPTSEKGFKGRSTPQGSVEEPINPISFFLEAGATYVARGFSGKLDELASIMEKAILHEGFSLVEILQPCVSFNNTYELYNSLVEVIDETPGTFEEALSLARRKDRLPIGVFYEIDKPVYHKELLGEWNPVEEKMSREERIKKVQEQLRFI